MHTRASSVQNNKAPCFRRIADGKAALYENFWKAAEHSVENDHEQPKSESAEPEPAESEQKSAESAESESESAEQESEPAEPAESAETEPRKFLKSGKIFPGREATLCHFFIAKSDKL